MGDRNFQWNRVKKKKDKQNCTQQGKYYLVKFLSFVCEYVRKNTSLRKIINLTTGVTVKGNDSEKKSFVLGMRENKAPN